MVCHRKATSAFEQWSENNLDSAIIWRLNPEMDAEVTPCNIRCAESDRAIIAIGVGCIASLCDWVEATAGIATLLVASYGEFGWLIKHNDLFQRALDLGVLIYLQPLEQLKRSNFVPGRLFRQEWLRGQLSWCTAELYRDVLPQIEAMIFDNLSFVRVFSPELLGGLVNFTKNLPHLSRIGVTRSLDEILRDVPIVIAGGGPSLNSALAVLKQHRDKALIFAAGAAIAPLLDSGIIPDLVGYIDPSEAQTIRSERLRNYRIPALISMSVYPQCLDNLLGPLLLRHENTFCDIGRKTLRHLGCCVPPPESSMAHDVIGCLQELALDLGARTIHFVGRDLSFVHSAYSDARIGDPHARVQYTTAEGVRSTTGGWLTAAVASAEILARYVVDCSTSAKYGLYTEGVRYLDTGVWFSALPSINIRSQWHDACAQLVPLMSDEKQLKHVQQLLIALIKGAAPTNQFEQEVSKMVDRCLKLFAQEVFEDPYSTNPEIIDALRAQIPI